MGRRPISRTRRIVHVTINQSLLPSLTTGQFLGQDLLANFANLTTDAGFTVLRTRIVLTPNVAPALNDAVTVGIAKCRNTDFGANVANGLTTSTTTYGYWHYLEAFTMNGGLVRGGGNVITISSRRMARIKEDDDGYGLFITSNFVAATQFRLWARTSVALP